jgi:hypothetical protein
MSAASMRIMSTEKKSTSDPFETEPKKDDLTLQPSREPAKLEPTPEEAKREKERLRRQS